MPLKLDYFYGGEAEQYSFYRIPKVLFTDQNYSTMTMEARVLYGLLLDRMGLSARNGWLDSCGRVFIYFTLEDAMAQMGFGHNKAVRHFKELEDIGLIERKKQGQGKPTRIYVKNFILPPEPGHSLPSPEAINGSFLPQMAYLVLLATVYTSLAQNVGQKHVEAPTAALLLSLESVFAVIFSIVFYGETLNAQLLVGFALIFAAILVSELAGARPKAKVAVAGDTPVSTIAGIIADEMAIGMINKKTTAVRLIPAVGKNVGDKIYFGGLLGEAGHASGERS